MNRIKPFGAIVKTQSFDNGKEICVHGKIVDALGSISYFARPFASWERGSNENFNGLLRKYVPKKRSMELITDEEIKMIEKRLKLPEKATGIQDALQGIPCLVKPCRTSSLNPPLN